MKIFKLTTLFVFFLLTLFTSSFAQKMKAEDIIEKYLDSIGTKEKRAEVRNQIIIGTAGYKIVHSATFASGNGQGNAVFLSEGNKLYFGMKFLSSGYTLDEVVYDGESVETGYIKPGQRSALGYYILNNRDIIKENLFGGSLFTGWRLFDLQARPSKMESGGTKKIDGRETYVVNYSIKGISPLSIKLYFDAKTFEHIRTEYRRVFPAPFTREQTANPFQVETIHLLTENFSDYKKENGLNLPHAYQINLLMSGKATDEIEWKFKLSEFNFNQKVDSASFQIK